MAGDASRQNGAKGGRPRGPSLRTLSLMKALLRNRELSADIVIEQMRRGALFDVRRLFDAEGNLKPIHELSEADAMPIAGVEVLKRKNGEDVDTVVKVRLADRGRYVEMAAKLYALLTERHEHEHHYRPDLSKLTEHELAALEELMSKASAEAVH